MMYEQVRQIRRLLPCEHRTNTVLLAVILNIDVPKVFRNMILDLPVALNNKAKGGKLHKKQALNELISSRNGNKVLVEQCRCESSNFMVPIGSYEVVSLTNLKCRPSRQMSCVVRSYALTWHGP